ncbi:Storkhead-box protein 1 [Orchesella cincta]|uniref:Storkhead-box protein 1 n=1 Tax=Orchesella cincta TaxID=48709 RepID=A0A1D2NAA7_ORCCI|nr:Storkhead-box protein 1 [Orchesella cincta]
MPVLVVAALSVLLATMDSHSQCMNTSRAPHSANPHHHSSGSRNGHHHRQEAPPPLPLRQPAQNDTCHVISGDTTAIRKYLVLLQDCLAIKFAPLVNGHQSHPIPFTFTSNKSCNSGHNNNCSGVDDEDDPLVSHRPTDLHHQRVSANSSKGGSNSINESHSNSRNLQSNHLGNHNSNNHHQHNHFPLGNNNSSIHNNEDPQQAFHLQNHHKSSRTEQFHFLQSSSGTASRPSASCNGVGAILGSNTAEVDHSLHGLYLYKGFKEANIQCYWNAALSETFKNIQYKGYIVPSTILVGALPKFLNILRTAWCRQMLRSPAGYRIEFIGKKCMCFGEIEEVIADPIQKGQFAPLSDSLCWAILELTSLGQEAFVDSIMSALQLTFPTMSCPSRELVFQTLEKLIKERKVYQTSRGYFVVTPDIFRYMLSGNFHNVESSPSFNNPGLTLDALLHPNCQEHDKLSFSHHSWDSAVSTGDHNRCSSTSTGEELIAVAPSPKLKRHNSLKTIRQRDVAVTQMSASTGQRRHSLRLPKSKSCGRMNDSIDDEEVKTAKVKSSTLEHISRAMRSLRTGASNTNSHDGGAGEAEKGKKNKSLLSKLFPFRRSNSKPRNEKITATTTSTKETTTKPASGSTTSSTSTSNSSMSPPTNSKHSGNVKDSAKFISTQTQTSNSTEQLCAPSITLSSSSHPVASSVPTGSNDKNSRMTGESSTPENSSDMDGCLLHQDCLNGDGSHQTRSSSRRSMSMLDESPLYDVLQDVPNIPGINQISPNFQVGCPVAPPTFPGFHRGESSRCSTLSSQATSSLGYGSQGHPSHLNTYSPNLDSGLASYGYYGDSSMSNSHSPCPSTGAYCSPSNHYGYNNRNSNCSTIFPQPAKPTAYSSARYKSSYEWYRKRYPNYISPVGRSSPLYASLTAPRTKSRSRPTYESLLTPNDVKHGGGLVQMVENHRCPSASQSQQQNANTNKTTLPVNATMGNNTNDAQGREHNSTNTTTVTQAVKSTTNMELELLLPLGKIMKAALHAKKDAIRDAWLRDELGPGYAAYADRYKSNHQSATASNNSNNESIKVNLDNTGAKLRVGEPSTKTEVTTVVNNNGVIETHFDSSSGINQPMFDLVSPNMKSTVEIKTLGGVTDVVLVNGKTGEETKILPTSNNNNSNQEKGQNNGAKLHVSSAPSNRSKSSGVTRKTNNAYEKIPDKRSPSSCVKISDIGKDSGAEEDVIKGC